MKIKSVLFSIFSVFIASTIHILSGQYYIYLAPPIEETLKFLSVKEETDKIDVIALYSLFGFLEFILYFLACQLPSCVYHRVFPFLFHVLTGIIMSLAPKNNRKIALLTNVLLHYGYLFMH